MTLDRFEELYERYSDGTLRPEERREFQAFLSEARYRARFVDLCAFEASLTEETHLLDEGGGPSVPWEEELAAPSLWRKECRSVSRRISGIRGRALESTHWVSSGILAAAGLFFAVGILMFMSSEDRETKGNRGPVARARVSQEVPPAAPPSEVLPKPALQARSEPPRRSAVDASPVPEAEASAKLVMIGAGQRPAEPPAPVPVPAPPRAEPRPATEVAPAPAPSVVLPIAQIEHAQGVVLLLSEEGPRAAEAGQGLRSGQGLRVGPGSSVAVKWSDGTRLELGADTEVTRLAEAAGGKMAQLEHGLLLVEAARQAAGHPLAILTPHSESKVLGTEFSLYTTPSYTRLDVREGRVKFTRLPGITSLIVRAGHYALAGAGFEFSERMTSSLWKPSMTGLQLWLRADSGVKLAGNSVAAWKDQSPAGNDATQADPPCQPSFVPGAVQGRPAIRFDGIDHFLALPSGFGDFRAGLSAFLVVKVGASPATMRILDFGEGPTCDNICLGRKDAPDKLSFWVYANCASRGAVTAPGGILIDQYQTLSVVSAPAPGQVTLYRNGTPIGSGITTVPRDVTRKPNLIGKSNGSGDALLKGDLCEVLLFNRVLKDEDRSSVERYLASKYFDSTAPPVPGRTAEK